MKQYNCYYENDFGDKYPAFYKESTDGDWVRVEDAARIIAHLRAVIAWGKPHARYVNVEGFQCGALYVEFLAGAEFGFGYLPDGTLGTTSYSRNDAANYVECGTWAAKQLT